MDLPQAVYTDNSDYLALGLTRYLLQKYEHTNIPISSAHTPTFLQQTRYLHLPGPAQLQRNNKRLGRPYADNVSKFVCFNPPAQEGRRS